MARSNHSHGMKAVEDLKQNMETLKTFMLRDIQEILKEKPKTWSMDLEDYSIPYFFAIPKHLTRFGEIYVYTHDISGEHPDCYEITTMMTLETLVYLYQLLVTE